MTAPVKVRETVHMVDMRTRQARTSQEYMRLKGYVDIRPVSCIDTGDAAAWYFYYELPEGLLEVEVCEMPDGTLRPRVTAFRLGETAAVLAS